MLAESATQDLERPSSFWDVVLGTGYRATVDALTPLQLGLLRERLLSELDARQVTTLRTDVIFGTARRPR